MTATFRRDDALLQHLQAIFGADIVTGAYAIEQGTNNTAFSPAAVLADDAAARPYDPQDSDSHYDPECNLRRIDFARICIVLSNGRAVELDISEWGSLRLMSSAAN